MQRRDLNAPDAPAPVAAYAQAIEVTGATRTLYISGQVGQRMDGTIPADIVEQSRLAWQNLEAQAQGRRHDLGQSRQGHHHPAKPWRPRRSARRSQRGAWRSPPGEHADRWRLANPAWKIEVEGIAFA
jgi:2-iminobutanoate/2-iminopropanoate deaminase